MKNARHNFEIYRQEFLDSSFISIVILRLRTQVFRQCNARGGGISLRRRVGMGRPERARALCPFRWPQPSARSAAFVRLLYCAPPLDFRQITNNLTFDMPRGGHNCRSTEAIKRPLALISERSSPTMEKIWPSSPL